MKARKNPSAASKSPFSKKNETKRNNAKASSSSSASSKIRKRGWSVHTNESSGGNDEGGVGEECLPSPVSSSDNDEKNMFDTQGLSSYQLMGFADGEGEDNEDDNEDSDGNDTEDGDGKDKDGVEEFDAAVELSKDNGNRGGELDASSSEKRKPQGKKSTTPTKSTKSTKSTKPTSSSSEADTAKEESNSSRLSNWARRFLDPNRPVAEILVPEIIPLDDVFLRSFNQSNGEAESLERGKREREEREEEAELGMYAGEEDGSLEKSSNKDSEGANTGKSNGDRKTEKIRLNNLPFTTGADAIKQKFIVFGDIKEVNLLEDEGRPGYNSGRCYITFFASDGEGGGDSPAKAAVEATDGRDFQGREIRVDIVDDSGRAPRKSIGGGGGGDSRRYWTKDISTKCYNCGEVGHISAACPNPPKSKPCPFCGLNHGNGVRCPMTVICFNCGLPGHERGKCPERRSLPPRQVCTTCFMSGHTRYQCNVGAGSIDSDGAICMSCGSLGHFMCGKLKWWNGGKKMIKEGSIYCSNCGNEGHLNFQCRRPRLDDCSRVQSIADEEIRLAGEFGRQEKERKEREKRRDGNYKTYHNQYNNNTSRDHSAFNSRGYEGGNGNGNGNGSSTNSKNGKRKRTNNTRMSPIEIDCDAPSSTHNKRHKRF